MYRQWDDSWAGQDWFLEWKIKLDIKQKYNTTKKIIFYFFYNHQFQTFLVRRCPLRHHHHPPRRHFQVLL